MQRLLWSRLLKVLGGLAMLVGTADPLEGSLLILPGSGLVALGVFLSGAQAKIVRFWLWSFALILIGVFAMFVLSAAGGIGGRGGNSMWWGIVLLPYPAGWLMAVAGGILALVRYFHRRVGPARG